MGDIAQVEIRAAVDQFKTDMASAGASFRQVMQGMGSDATSVRPALEEHGSLISSLSEKLREHRTEHVQTARAVHSFTSELEGIIGPGNEAAKALGMVVGGFAIGGLMGVAIEGVKLLVEKIREVPEGEAEAAKALKSWMDESDARIKAAGKELDALADKFDHVTGAMKALRSAGGVGFDIGEVKKQIESAQDLIAYVADNPDQEEMFAPGVEKASKELPGLIAKLQELQKEQAILQGAANVADAGAFATAEREASNAVRVRLAQQAVDQEKATAKAIEEKKKEIEAQKDLDLKNYANELGLEEAADREKTKLADKALAADNARMETERQEHEKAAADLVKAQAKATEALMKDADMVGKSFGAAFAGIIDGSKSMYQAIGDVMKSIVKAVVDAAVKSVEAYAISAEGAAAFSQAGIPIVGPILAVGAIAAMGALFDGLLSKLTSSAGGYEVPSYVSASLGVLHANETVLPADLSTGLKDMIRGGGASGQAAPTSQGDTFVIHALDSRSFEDALRRNASGLLKVKGELVRKNRW